MIAALIILFFVVLILTAFGHRSQIRLRDKENVLDQNIWHLSSAAIRGLLAGVIIHSKFGCSLESVRLWVLFQLFWWLLFDELLNFLRKKQLWYVGYNDIIDKTIRKIASALEVSPEITGVLLKIICILLVLLI